MSGHNFALFERKKNLLFEQNIKSPAKGNRKQDSKFSRTEHNFDTSKEIRKREKKCLVTTAVPSPLSKLLLGIYATMKNNFCIIYMYVTKIFQAKKIALFVCPKKKSLFCKMENKENFFFRKVSTFGTRKKSFMQE